MKTFCLVVAIAAIVAGCASVTPLRTGAALPARPDDCPIEVRHTMPTRAFDEVGTLKMSGGDGDLGRYLEDLKVEACRMGGDAVLVQSSGTATTTSSNLFIGTTYHSGAAGNAIVLKYK